MSETKEYASQVLENGTIQISDEVIVSIATAAIRDVEYFEQTRTAIMKTREQTVDRLRKLGFFVHESNANFIFITHPAKSGKELQQGLRDRGVLVRWFNKPRIDQYLRVSIGTDAEMEKMCAACEEILKG